MQKRFDFTEKERKKEREVERSDMQEIQANSMVGLHISSGAEIISFTWFLILLTRVWSHVTIESNE